MGVRNERLPNFKKKVVSGLIFLIPKGFGGRGRGPKFWGVGAVVVSPQTNYEGKLPTMIGGFPGFMFKNKPTISWGEPGEIYIIIRV